MLQMTPYVHCRQVYDAYYTEQEVHRSRNFEIDRHGAHYALALRALSKIYIRAAIEVIDDSRGGFGIASARRQCSPAR